MNIIINRKELLKQMQIADTAIVNDKTGSIKSGMILEAKDNKLSFKTSGDGLYIITSTNCNVIKEGKVNIRHTLIEEFLKQLDDEQIEIKVGDTALSIITQTNIETNFAILENIDVTIPEINVDSEFVFNKDEFLEKLEKVKFAASNQPDLENLNCIRMEIEENKLKLVSTDSFRLMYLEENYSTVDKLGVIVNIPIRTIEGLVKILRIVYDETLTIKSEGIRIVFIIGDIKIYSKLIETQFPNYESIFVALESQKEIILNLNSYKTLLKRLQVFEKDEKGTSVIFKLKNNKMEASINNTSSKFKEQIDIVYNDEEEITVSISVKFILEYLNTLKDEDELFIKMDNSDRKPVVMYTNKEDRNYYFVMPTKI